MRRQFSIKFANSDLRLTLYGSAGGTGWFLRRPAFAGRPSAVGRLRPLGHERRRTLQSPLTKTGTSPPPFSDFNGGHWPAGDVSHYQAMTVPVIRRKGRKRGTIMNFVVGNVTKSTRGKFKNRRTLSTEDKPCVQLP